MEMTTSVIRGWVVAGQSGSITVLASLVCTFFAVVLFVIVSYDLWVSRTQYRQRLAGDTNDSTANEEQPSLWYTDKGTLVRISKSVEKYVGSSAADIHSKVRRDLIQAGFLHPAAPSVFFATRFLLGLVLPAAFVLVAPFVLRNLSGTVLLLIGAVLGIAGLMLPRIWVQLRRSRRQQAVRESFPDALDLLLVCVEAGLGLDAALDRVSQEIGRAHPILAEHLRLTSLEIRAGKTREDAMRNLAERTGLDEVSSFTTLLLQSEMLGTSVAQTLRVHVHEMRSKRILQAEEKAQALAVKLSVLLVAFILPALMIVILTPAVLNIGRVLFPAAEQGMSVLK